MDDSFELDDLEMLEEMDQMVDLIQQRKKKRRRGDIRLHLALETRVRSLAKLQSMTDEEFKRYTRLPRTLFYDLLNQITPLIEASSRGRRNAANACTAAILPEIKLVSALRYLAGGSYLDIAFSFGVSTSNFHRIDGVLWGTISSLQFVLKDVINFPTDEEQLKKIEKGFSEFSYNRLQGCVMAVDGWVVHVRKPFRSEVNNTTCFRNRKDCYGLVVLAGVDSNCRYMLFSVCSPGSTNDCVAWEFCSVYREVILKNILPQSYYIIGDEGFINTKNFLTPYSGHNLGIYEDSFNFHLSRMRQCVERSFGMMKSRWGIFWRPLQCAYDRWKLVLQVTASLHNLCVDIQDADPDPDIIIDDNDNQNEFNISFEHNVADIVNSELYSTIASNNSRREQLTEHLKMNGFTRPCRLV